MLTGTLKDSALARLALISPSFPPSSCPYSRLFQSFTRFQLASMISCIDSIFSSCAEFLFLITSNWLINSLLISSVSRLLQFMDITFNKQSLSSLVISQLSLREQMMRLEVLMMQWMILQVQKRASLDGVWNRDFREDQWCSEVQGWGLKRLSQRMLSTQIRARLNSSLSLMQEYQSNQERTVQMEGTRIWMYQRSSKYLESLRRVLNWSQASKDTLPSEKQLTQHSPSPSDFSSRIYIFLLLWSMNTLSLSCCEEAYSRWVGWIFSNSFSWSSQSYWLTFWEILLVFSLASSLRFRKS